MACIQDNCKAAAMAGSVGYLSAVRVYNFVCREHVKLETAGDIETACRAVQNIALASKIVPAYVPLELIMLRIAHDNKIKFVSILR